MIRVLDSYDVVSGKFKYYEFAGTSQDQKPSGEKICTGSVFTEVDTGKVYLFNEDSRQWVKVGD